MSEERYAFKIFDIEANEDGSEPSLVFYLMDSFERRIRFSLSGAVVEIPNGETNSRGFYKYKLDNLATVEHLAKEKGLV